MARLLAEQLHRESALSEPEIEHLHLLLGDWQLLSDLSFADLVLWVRMRGGEWRAVAHVRPNTGQMVFFEDIVGQQALGDRARLLDRALAEGAILRRGGPLLDHDHAILRRYSVQ